MAVCQRSQWELDDLSLCESDGDLIDAVMDSRESALKLLQSYAEQGLTEKFTESFFHSLAQLPAVGNVEESLLDISDKFDNYTPLILAAKNGKVDCVRVLCELGHANIDKKAGWNETTALMKAAEKGHYQVVDTLLSLGADINLRNSFGNTALMLAAEKGRTDVVFVLLDSSLSIEMDVKNNYQYTALILAAENGHSDVVTLLIKYGAGMDFQNMFGKTALIMAGENGQASVVEALCDAGADVNLRSKRGVSALMLASVKGHLSCVEVLTREQYNVDIHVENNDRSDTALTMACLGGNPTIVKHLVDCGANVLYRNANKETVLMKACERGDQASMDFLFSHYTSPLDILVVLTAQNKSGNSCLMRASSKGNVKVMVWIMRKVAYQIDNNLMLLRKASRSNRENGELARLLVNYPTTDAFTRAVYRGTTNKEGDSAMTIISKYYRDNPHKFMDYVIEATSFSGRVYLLEMLPNIFPNFVSPNTVLNGCKEVLFSRLRKLEGYQSDLRLLGRLVNIAAALKLSSEAHSLESREMDELFAKVEGAIKACMFSTSMDVPANVTKILHDETKEHAEIVLQALAFVNGPLEMCIRHHLTGLLGTAQICTHVNEVFFASLKPTPRTVIRELPDLFQIRSGCTTFRYRPAFMFFLEGLSKAVYLLLVAMVSYYDCGAEAECVLSPGWNRSEVAVAVMCITGTLFELGEVLHRGQLNAHMADIWNALDVISNSLVLSWVLFRAFPSQHYMARGFLAISAVPMSIALLRFLSTFQYLGQLVIVIFAMSQDLGAFLFVFLMSILGFGIAFHSLFPSIPEFSASGTTFLTLFNAALGDHNFANFENHKFQFVGVPMMTLYAMFVTIILLNLIIAQMSSTFEKMNEKSFEQWSMVMAKNVQDWLMISEKTNPLCMIPPPLNAISCMVWPFDRWQRRRVHQSDEETPLISICGSVSDTIIALLTAPFCAVLEVYLVNAELWGSQIPRVNALFVTVMSVVLFPVWYLMYLVLLLHNICTMEPTLVSERTNRIIYGTPRDMADLYIRKLMMGVLFVMFCPCWFLYCFDLALTWSFREFNVRLQKRRAEVRGGASGSDKKSSPSPGPAFYNRRQSSASTWRSAAGTGSEADFSFRESLPSLSLRSESLLPSAASNRSQRHLSESAPDGPSGASASEKSSGDPKGAFIPPMPGPRPTLTVANETDKTLGSERKKQLRFSEKQLDTSSSPKAKSDAASKLTPAAAPRGPLTLFEERAVKAYFLFTCPVWLLAIFVCFVVACLRVPEVSDVDSESSDDYDTHERPSGGAGMALALGTKSTDVGPSAALDAGNVGKATGGRLTVRLLRLDLQGRVGLFGRRTNTYVKAVYGTQNKQSPTVVYDPSGPLQFSRVQCDFDLTDLNQVLFQVFDRDTTDATSAGVMVDDALVDIRPWIANGRFEGNQKLKNRDGVEAGDSIQLAVKISYPETTTASNTRKAAPAAPSTVAAVAAACAPSTSPHGPSTSTSRTSRGLTKGCGDQVGINRSSELWIDYERKPPLFTVQDRARIFESLTEAVTVSPVGGEPTNNSGSTDSCKTADVSAVENYCPDCHIIVR